MAAPSGKGDLRGAAERIERGIELYGAGDLNGALAELEEALKLHPTSARARSYVAWIRGLQAGTHHVDGKKEGLDEDAVRAVSEALDEPSSPGDRPSALTAATTPDAAIGRPEAIPPIARDIADDHEQEPTLERRDVKHLLREPNAPLSVNEGDSPWDPVPLTPTNPTGSEPRKPDPLHELQAAATKSKKLGSSSTLLGMPPLEPPRLLQPDKRKRVAEDRPESVTREFRSQTPTGQNLRPLDVPELTDEQIAGLLALDSPLIPEGRTTPQIELDRIDELEPPPARLQPEPSPPARTPRKNDTTPTPIDAISTGEFDSVSLTPTGVKPAPLRPVAQTAPEDDPYADLNLLPLEVSADFSSDDQSEGTNPTNPFIRGPKLAKYTSYGTEPKLDALPSPPPTGQRAPAPIGPATEPGMTQPRAGSGSQPRITAPPSQPRITAPPSQPRITAPGSQPRIPQAGPLARAEAALATGDTGAALEASEAALQQAGAGAAELINVNRALFESIYGAVLGGLERTLGHGQATPDLDPRQAFLLSRIDGAMTVEDVLDVSGMPRVEAMRLLALLTRRGAVKLR